MEAPKWSGSSTSGTPFNVKVDEIHEGMDEVDWTGLGWLGVSCTGLSLVGLGSAGLGWAVLCICLANICKSIGFCNANTRKVDNSMAAWLVGWRPCCYLPFA